MVGGLAAKLRDSGIPDERLKQIGDALPPGSSALIAVIEHRWVKDLENQLSEAGAEVMTETISADIAEQLEAGRDVAYTAVKTEDEIAAGRAAVGEDQVEVGGLVVTEDGLAFADAVVTLGEGEEETASEEE